MLEHFSGNDAKCSNFFPRKLEMDYLLKCLKISLKVAYNVGLNIKILSMLSTTLSGSRSK